MSDSRLSQRQVGQGVITQRQTLGLRYISSTLDALPPSQRLLLLGLIVLAGFLVRISFIHTVAYPDDIALFVKWVETALTYPPSQLYDRGTRLNYPPGYALILELTAYVYRSLPHVGQDVPLIETLIKLPALVLDLVGSIVAYILVRRFASPSQALAAAAYFAFNPAIIYISAYWSQIDSIPTVLALTAVLLLLSGIETLAWPVLVFAALVKPPVLILAPLFFVYPFTAERAPERRRRFLGAAAGIVLALTLTEVLAFTFFPHSTLIAPTRALIGKLHQGSSEFPYTSLNAFNLWAVFQDFFSSDRVHWGPVIMKHWAQALFVGVASIIIAAYAWRRSAISFLEAAVLLFLAFFLFMPEMHERYEIYAATFAGVLLFRRSFAIAAAVLSTTTLLSLEYALTYLFLSKAPSAVNVNEFAPCLVHLCALANLGIFVWLAACYFGPLKRSLPGRARSAFGADAISAGSS